MRAPFCYLLSVGCVATALLSACGGSTPSVMRNGAAAQFAPAAATKGAWSGDLLYVATGSDVYVLSYPSGKLVGNLPPYSSSQGAYSLCSDKRGKVFVVGLGGIAEYSHRGMHVATLTSPDVPTSCSIDPTTGNLAVPYVGSGGPYVVIYRHAREPGKKVYDIPFPVPGLCGYDIHGNLFVDGLYDPTILVELPKGSTSFVNYRLRPRFDQFDSIHWDGTYLALSNPKTHSIYRVQLSRHWVKIVGATRVQGWDGGSSRTNGGTQTWLKDGKFIAQWQNGSRLGIWSYPTGGSPTSILPPFASGPTSVDGVVLSSAPH